MAIRYVHNDPASVPFLETQVAPRPGRTGALARFTQENPPPEQVYALQTPEFIDWQCREAALRTLQAWERVSAPLRSWRNAQRAMPLDPRGATDLAATYDRVSIRFGQWPAGTPTFFVGASTDAVSHEVAHAILDARRPELWDSLFAEVAAFHEGFADCVSLLVSLLDDEVVAALFASAVNALDVLNERNVSSQVAESVAAEIRSVFGSRHPASQPRRLRNTLQWAIPTTLPPNPTPTNLSREPHSFGRVFSGCFYDCVNNIYRNAGPHDAGGLQNAARSAGELLAAAVESAPEEIRFFRSVGRAMIHADSQLNTGRNHLSVRDAFGAHNVALGSSMQLAPTMALDGPAPSLGVAASRALNPNTRSDLTRRAGVPGDVRIATRSVKIGATTVLRASLRRRTPVRVPGAGPQDVLGRVNEEVLIGSERHRSVVLGELPNRVTTEEEVAAFVEGLSDSGALDRSASHRDRTHAVRKEKGKQVLRRVRFTCNGAR
jgi:hypothetical protein